MHLSAAHLAARVAAARVAALDASLSLLRTGNGRARIELLDGADLILATGYLQDGAGTTDHTLVQIMLSTPFEAAIGQAGTPVSARIFTAPGDLWADGITVSDTAGAGALKLETTDLQRGHFVRVLSAVIQG